MSRVVVLSPSVKSLYTASVLAALKAQGVEVAAVVVRRLLDVRRVKSEWRRDRERLLRKAYVKLLLRERVRSTTPTLRDTAMALGVADLDVRTLCSGEGIELLAAADHNAPEVLALLQRLKPDAVVFTGGGLVRQPLLQRAGHGVVNCHAGVLPRYRGMDVVEWALFEGRLDDVGLTCHLMDSGIDTGAILTVTRIDPRGEPSIASLRRTMESRMPEVMTNAVVGLLDGSLSPAPQRPEDGRQYFIMDARLRALAEKRLSEG